MKEKSAEVKRLMLGMVGERIVAHYLRKQGHEVEESLDPFDSEKDMLVDGQRAEVKTQVPFLMEDSFGVHPNQAVKLRKNHRTYFISVPPPTRVDQHAGYIYELDSSIEFKCYRKKLASGREVLCIPRNQSAMRKIQKIEDSNLLASLQYLTTSNI